MTFKRIDEPGNPYSAKVIEFLVFNYDGQGGALVLSDGEFMKWELSDVEIIVGEDENGDRNYEYCAN